MKASIEQGYTLIKQKKRCCVPACMYMILERRGLPSFDQEAIGKHIGLVVSKEIAEEEGFKDVEIAEEMPPGGYGTRTNEEEYSLDAFFSKENLPLKSDYYTLDDIEDVPSFIGDNLKDGNDIIVCFRVRHLYHDIDKEEVGDAGHITLISEIEDDKVTLADTHFPEYRMVALEKLMEAIDYHRTDDIYDTPLGGFWVISSK